MKQSTGNINSTMAVGNVAHNNTEVSAPTGKKGKTGPFHSWGASSWLSVTALVLSVTAMVLVFTKSNFLFLAPEFLVSVLSLITAVLLVKQLFDAATTGRRLAETEAELNRLNASVSTLAEPLLSARIYISIFHVRGCEGYTAGYDSLLGRICQQLRDIQGNALTQDYRAGLSESILSDLCCYFDDCTPFPDCRSEPYLIDNCEQIKELYYMTRPERRVYYSFLIVSPPSKK